MDDLTRWLLELVDSPWLYPALFLLVVADAFLVVLPSESLVVALGALAGATGHPSVFLVAPVAALGALVGDSLCYLIGRRIGIDRWRWQRTGRVAAALARARKTVLTRPAVLIFTARYIPYARIAVNFSAGAVRLPLTRFLPLAAFAGSSWAIYNLAVGALFGAALPKSPLLAIVLSVIVAIGVGILIDLILQRVSAHRTARARRSARAAPVARPEPDAEGSG